VSRRIRRRPSWDRNGEKKANFRVVFLHWLVLPIVLVVVLVLGFLIVAGYDGEMRWEKIHQRRQRSFSMGDCRPWPLTTVPTLATERNKQQKERIVSQKLVSGDRRGSLVSTLTNSRTFRWSKWDLGNAVRAGLADEELSRLPPLSNKKKRRKLSAPGVGIVDSLNI
jgi:hypothetical protein